MHSIRYSVGQPKISHWLLIVGLIVSPQTAWALANPASVFCVKSGGKSEFRKGPNGDYGICRLPDGRVVEEWTYFRERKRGR
jgi:putative hemolysin